MGQMLARSSQTNILEPLSFRNHVAASYRVSYLIQTTFEVFRDKTLEPQSPQVNCLELYNFLVIDL